MPVLDVRPPPLPVCVQVILRIASNVHETVDTHLSGMISHAEQMHGAIVQLKQTMACAERAMNDAVAEAFVVFEDVSGVIIATETAAKGTPACGALTRLSHRTLLAALTHGVHTPLYMPSGGKMYTPTRVSAMSEEPRSGMVERRVCVWMGQGRGGQVSTQKCETFDERTQGGGTSSLDGWTE